MPTSIPFDSSLVLGQVINPDKVEKLQAIAAAQKPVDDAEADLNSLIAAKLSLELSILQVKSLGVEISESTASSVEKLNDAIKTAANTLVEEQITAYVGDDTADDTDDPTYGTVAKARLEASNAEDYDLNVSTESPIDFTRSVIAKLPFASNSVNFDSQYFSFDQNDQNSQSTVLNIKSFVAASVKFLGAERTAQFSQAVANQASYQLSTHNVIGTLVITASATHEDAKVFSPLVLDVDKSIEIWNSLNEENQITDESATGMQEIIDSETSADENIQLLSGMTMGSSFVGMVHVLHSERTDTSQRMSSVSASLQSQMKAGGWFAHMNGGFGVDAYFSSDVKKLLSQQEISSHCSIVSMGCIPSVKSSTVQIGVKEFADFDPKTTMDKLAALSNTTTNETNSLDASAEAARTGKKMVSMRGAEIKSVMTSLGQIDDGQNQMLDVKSLMIAFEDYVSQIRSGDCGVPINFYVSKISKRRIAKSWMDEKFPDGAPEADDVAESAEEIGDTGDEVAVVEPELSAFNQPEAAAVANRGLASFFTTERAAVTEPELASFLSTERAAVIEPAAAGFIEPRATEATVSEPELGSFSAPEAVTFAEAALTPVVRSDLSSAARSLTRSTPPSAAPGSSVSAVPSEATAEAGGAEAAETAEAAEAIEARRLSFPLSIITESERSR